MIAEAPFEQACSMNLAPSCRVPGMATKQAPGRTFRESSVNEDNKARGIGSPPMGTTPAAAIRSERFRGGFDIPLQPASGKQASILANPRLYSVFARISSLRRLVVNHRESDRVFNTTWIVTSGADASGRGTERPFSFH
jgi:hypothetical protein